MPYVVFSMEILNGIILNYLKLQIFTVGKLQIRLSKEHINQIHPTNIALSFDRISSIWL